MLFPQKIVDHITQSAYWADRMVRADLIQGFIAGENDYTSNFTSEFRRQINARSITGLKATSYVLKPTVERSLGADGCIILSNTNEFKVGIFEAKFPRLKTRKDYWDFIQKSTGYSHFHNQLERQRSYEKIFAIWVMFYLEFSFGTQPSFMPNCVSACAWHENALQVSRNRANTTVPWTDNDLEILLSQYSIQIDVILREICECQKGKVFEGNNYLSVLADYNVPEEMLVIEYSMEIEQNG